MRDLLPLIRGVAPRMRELRRELHMRPELGYEELETSRRILEVLREIPGLEIRTGVAVTGIVATLAAEKSGSCVALRSDMDALPMNDESGLSYASRIPGRAHTCGHDGHIASLLGAALVLSEIRDELHGPVKFLFQPAEEGGAGARRMVEEGALDNPSVAAVFGYHNVPFTNLPFGAVATRPGPFMAACSSFNVKIRGKGGHAAYPQGTIDPILVGAHLINAWQTIVSRSLDPVNNGVLSVTAFDSGNNPDGAPVHNIIAAEALLRGTIRALDDSVIAKAEERFHAITHNVCAAFGASAEVEFRGRYPCLRNDPGCVDHVAKVARQTGRGTDLRENYPPVMGGEDFAYYCARVPSCFYFIGSKPNDLAEAPMCHNTKFDFNDDILPDAIAMHVEIARRFSRKN